MNILQSLEGETHETTDQFFEVALPGVEIQTCEMRRRKELMSVLLATKKFPAINQRIEILGQMNDRHIQASGNQDKQALRDLANEYKAIGCPRLAEEIKTEAKAIRRKRVDRTAVNVDTDINVDERSDITTPEMAVTP
jgi:hypothetical protein